MSNSNWEDVYFLAHVNIKNIIGKELINDDNVAVMELVKNSYDAGATEVKVEFKALKNKKRDNHQIIIADDGIGMSKDDILHKWLNLAYSIKKIQNSQNQRLQAGNKGIGRFSCDRLGKKLDIYTKQENSKIYHLRINWEDFENKQEYNVQIHQIPMKLREIDEKNVKNETGYSLKDRGTIIKISNLRVQWIKINHESLFNEVLNYQRFFTLKSSLEKLINKNQVEKNNFEILLIAKDIEDKDETSYYKKINGKIKNKFFEKLNFNTTYIHSAISDDGKYIITKLKDRDKIIFKSIEKNIEFPALKGVKLILMYLNPYAKVYFENQMGLKSIDFGSVFLFINGFRIPPYGDIDNDAFGMEVRKNQGRSRYISNREIIGRIEIEDRENRFKIISSRESVVQNESFKQLIHKSTKSSIRQTKNNGFFYKTLRRLEKYVVDGIKWDSTPKDITESKIQEMVKQNNWKEEKEVYILKRKKKLENISKKIFTIMRLNSKDIVDLYLSEDIMNNLIENNKLNTQKNITLFLKEFSKIPQYAIDKQTEKFVKQMIKSISDKGLARQIDILFKNKANILDEILEKEVSYSELDKKIIVLETTQEALEKELNLVKVHNKKKDEELTYLKTVQSKDVKELIAFQHHIGLYTKTAKDCILDVVDMLNDSNVSNIEVFEYLKDASFELDKISLINKYITKEDFLSKATNVKKDLIRFIADYIRNIYEVTTNKELMIKINTNNLKYKCSFEPIKINIIIDNLLNNSKKAKAKNVNIYFRKNNDYIELEYTDDGNGLDSTIIEPESVFEMGVTSTKGSGLGLYHIKEILEEMNNSLINVYKVEEGIKFIIRFKL